MNTRKGFTTPTKIFVILVLVLLLILLSPIKKAIERARIKQTSFVIYKGFVVRVLDGTLCPNRCQKHLIMETNNTETSRPRALISACSFQNHPDPNDIQFKVIDIRNVPEEHPKHPLLELATFKEIEKAYRYFRTEQARREKEKADSTKATIDPRKLTSGPVP